jgi:hypothetical protein
MDKIDSFALPDIRQEEIDDIFNINIDRFIKQRYGKNNLKRESFEETQKRIDDLRTLVEIADPNLPANESAEGRDYYTFDIPDRYYFLLRSKAYVKMTYCGVQYGADEDVRDDNGKLIATTALRPVFVKQVQIDDIEAHLDDPFNRPGDSKVLLTFENGRMRIYVDATIDISVKELEVEYLRRPAKVSLADTIGFDLPEHTHHELVEMAANWALESIESGRYPSHSQELTKIE